MTRILWTLFFLSALTLTPSWAEVIFPTCAEMQNKNYRESDIVTTKVENKQGIQKKTLLVKFRVMRGTENTVGTVQSPPSQKESSSPKPALKDQKIIRTQPMTFSCTESYETLFQNREGIKRTQLERVITFIEVQPTASPGNKEVNPLAVKPAIRKDHRH